MYKNIKKELEENMKIYKNPQLSENEKDKILMSKDWRKVYMDLNNIVSKISINKKQP